MILPPATLAQADTPTRKPWRSDQGRPLKKSAGPRRTHPDRLRPCLDPDHPHDGPRSPQTGAPAAGYASPTATGTAHRGPRETPYTHARETETVHNATGKPQNERKIKPGEFTPGKIKCSTEPPRRRHAKRAGGRQQGSKTPQQGRTPTRAKRKPAGSVAPGGFESLKQGLEHGHAKNNDVYDQHGCTSSRCPPLLRISPATASFK